MQRCSWVNQDPLYIEYHDNEWGKPVHDNQKLFEKICLEGQQAGLSWITVLKKRETYRQCFHHFDPVKIAAMTEKDIDKLMENAGLIRHRGKLEAIVHNAKAYLAMQAAGEDFATFIWSFVGNQPILNHLSMKKPAEFLASTPISDAMAKALKKRGFKFFGTTTCYAFMQSMGLVNDHMIECFCHPDNPS
ncbi:DNA-3-methyladenine glycosylase I [Limnobaculum parvum]|uniref:DNA-3-methyladenine glycosylase I n=1 Tax=Limnobaculum parvum TaxID=2172103 RepID=A0A2Y9TZN5_9GAMM|nr:DNA-3-methyladenine glycosylase I [Limnobaculum parvum]AWH88961.1 DNA-3-methyladenine glycosylase I [Limnobaculum parvum]